MSTVLTEFTVLLDQETLKGLRFQSSTFSNFTWVLSGDGENLLTPKYTSSDHFPTGLNLELPFTLSICRRTSVWLLSTIPPPLPSQKILHEVCLDYRKRSCLSFVPKTQPETYVLTIFGVCLFVFERVYFQDHFLNNRWRYVFSFFGFFGLLSFIVEVTEKFAK